MKRKQKDVKIGDIYHRLTIVKFEKNDKRYRKMYLCRCECGTEKILRSQDFLNGNTKSCGCLSKETGSKRRKPNNGSEVTAIILSYKRHALSRKIKWELSREDVLNLIFKNCYYCNDEPSNLKKTKNSTDGLKYSGIDRIDSSKDYSTENCVPCCKNCNLAKKDMSINDFRLWVSKLISNFNQWG